SSDFQSQDGELVREFCMLGATDDGFARLFEVPRSAIDDWIEEVSNFAAGIGAGRDLTDTIIAERKAGCLPVDPALLAEFGAVEYGYDAADAIVVADRDDRRRSGLASPDDGDALGVTFAHPVFLPDLPEESPHEEKLRLLKTRIG